MLVCTDRAAGLAWDSYSKTEAERIIYEDLHPKTGFVLLPDFKWSDTSNVSASCLVAVCRDQSLMLVLCAVIL